MKVMFLGTPEFAVPALKSILASRHEVVAVVTQPDRALKRGKTEISPVKQAAMEAGVAVLQPARIRDEVELLKSFGADIAVTAAYGQILTQAVIDAFSCGVINIHASVLPKYRGASPIQSAIRNGDKESGVTVMQTELGIDTGDILGVKRTAIGDTETQGELTARLSVLGAELVVEVLDNYGEIKPVKQDDSLATHCSVIKKAEEYIDFCAASADIVNFIRALSPHPCAKTVINGEIYKIYSARACEGGGAPGEITEGEKRLVIACKGGAVEVTSLQAPGKNRLDTDAFLRGKRFKAGTLCEKIDA